LPHWTTPAKRAILVIPRIGRLERLAGLPGVVTALEAVH